MSNLHRTRNSLISQLHDDFDKLLAPFTGSNILEFPRLSLTEWNPSIDFKETENQYVILADLPGVKVSDIEVYMENGTLTIKGKREYEKKDKSDNYLCEERFSGSFIRQMSIPGSIDKDNIQAKCHNGVLEVTLNKTEKGKTKQIEVKEE